MSLCIATDIQSQFVIMADGRALRDGRIASDNFQKLFVIDGRAVFVNGNADMNLEVIRLLEKNNDSSASFVSSVCREVLNKYRNRTEVKRWIEEYETRATTEETSIPICVTTFEYKHNDGCYFNVFTMENNFESNPQRLRAGATLYRGARMEEAKTILRTKVPISGSLGFINKVLETFQELDNTYIEVGGNVTIVTMGANGITLEKMKKKDSYNMFSETDGLSQTYLIGKSGKVVLDQDGILQTDTLQEADNVDATHPLKLKFYIDDDVMRIDKVKLSFSLERFRAYSKGAASQTINLNSTMSEKIQLYTTEERSFDISSTDPKDITGDTRTEGFYSGTGGHNHGIPERTRLATHPVSSGGYVEFVSSGNHSHPIVLPSHKHTFTVPSHSHSINMPSHSHQINMPPHSHDIEYGIYEGTAASGVQIKIDGVIRNSTTYFSDTNIEITQWIQTPGWHTVELTSNQLGRINASIFTKTFVGSN